MATQDVQHTIANFPGTFAFDGTRQYVNPLTGIFAPEWLATNEARFMGHGFYQNYWRMSGATQG